MSVRQPWPDPRMLGAIALAVLSVTFVDAAAAFLIALAVVAVLALRYFQPAAPLGESLATGLVGGVVVVAVLVPSLIGAHHLGELVFYDLDGGNPGKAMTIVLTVIALLAAWTFAAWRWKRHERLTVVAAVVIPSAIGLLYLAAQAFQYVVGGDAGKAVKIVFILMAILSIWVFVAVRWKRSEWQFLVVSLLFFGLLKIAYVVLVDAPPISDFRTMLHFADEWVANGSIGDITRPQAERALLYLYPIRAVFGAEGDNYQYVNVIVSLVTAFVTYCVTRIFFGGAAARVAIVVALIAVEPLQAAEIPTHDIPGALAVMSFILLLVLLWRDRSDARSWGWSALIGLVLVWAGLQRSVTAVLLLSLILFAVLTLMQVGADSTTRAQRWFAVGRWLLLLLAVPVAVDLLFVAGLNRADLKRDAGDVAEHRAALIIAHSESWGNGTYRYRKDNWNHEESFPEPLSFAIKRYMSDTYYSPWSRLAHFTRKAERLYSLGTQQTFYLTSGGSVGEEPIERRHWLRARVVASAFGSIFLIFMSGGVILTLLTRRKSPAHLVPLIVLATFGGPLILFAEVQPRYIFPVWYIGSIYFGAFLAAAASRLRSGAEWTRSKMKEEAA